jgi:hypothetical protein
MRVGLTISILAHSATLVAVLLCFPLHQPPSPQAIPVSVATIGDTENLGFQVSARPEHGGSASAKSKPILSSPQAKAEQTLVVAKLTETPPEGNQASVWQIPHPLASNQSDIAADQEALAAPHDASSKASSGQPLGATETSLWNTTQTSLPDGSSTKGFVEEQSGQPPGLKMTRHTDWAANPVEDNTVTYSAPDSSMKFTVREAHSAGFAGSAFTPGFGRVTRI